MIGTSQMPGNALMIFLSSRPGEAPAAPAGPALEGTRVLLAARRL